jgi:hypothetical protein
MTIQSRAVRQNQRSGGERSTIEAAEDGEAVEGAGEAVEAVGDQDGDIEDPDKNRI